MSGLLLLRTRVPAISLLSRFRSLQTRHYGLLGKPDRNSPDPHGLPQTPARTRFAPSPTGYLHLGSIRTALYNYLLARATGGQFIIRLEDTDRTRFVEDSEQKLYDDLRWAGMDWDEGPDKGGAFGPYRQSERLGLYTQHAEKLLDNGHAFRCFCPAKPAGESTVESTDESTVKSTVESTGESAGESESGWATGYPGTCKHIPRSESDRRAANGEPHVIRFNSSQEHVEYVDIVYGLRRVKSSGGYPIIIKTDGFPTYHFANIVDDHHMKITHVIRGAEWLVSTPLHIEMYNALQWNPPRFGHVGLLVDQQRQKLSKRDKENIGVSVFRSNSILPPVLMNFAIHLGWNSQLGKNVHLMRDGVMTMKDMQDNFSLKFTRGDIVVDLTKLKFFQAKWTKNLITGVIDDPSTLDEHIVKPVTSVVERVEKTVYERHKFEMNRKRKQKPPPVPATEIPFLEDLGINIEYHRSLTYRYEKWPIKKHVLAVLKAAKGKYLTPEQFVRDCKYAFFTPTTKALADSAHVLQPDFTKAKVYLGSPDRENHSRFSYTSLQQISITRVLQIFQTHLVDLERYQPTAVDKRGKKLLKPKKEKLPLAPWTAERIKTTLSVVADTIKAVFMKRAGPMEDLTAPWRYMRWAYMCAQPESEHVSIARLIEAWGPERSHAILSRARRNAATIEALHEKTLRREKKERLKAIQLAERQMKEIDTRVDDKLAQRNERNELLLYTAEVEDNIFRRALRGAHLQGPFASNAVPHLQLAAAAAAAEQPTYKERTSPADVDRLPQILSTSEFKEATRHLPEEQAQKHLTEEQMREAATFNGRLPLGVIPHALGSDDVALLESAKERERQRAEEQVREEYPWFLPDRNLEEVLPKEEPTDFKPPVPKTPPLGPFAPRGTPRRTYQVTQARLVAQTVLRRLRGQEEESAEGPGADMRHPSDLPPALGIPDQTGIPMGTMRAPQRATGRSAQGATEDADADGGTVSWRPLKVSAAGERET